MQNFQIPSFVVVAVAAEQVAKVQMRNLKTDSFEMFEGPVA